jgi:hypothetical protein
VTEPLSVVRIPPGAVLSYKTAPAIPASWPPIRYYNESHHDGIPHATIPGPLDDRAQVDPEFALAFALTIQMSAIPLCNGLKRDASDTHTGPLDWRASGMAIYRAYRRTVSPLQYSGKKARKEIGNIVEHSFRELR